MRVPWGSRPAPISEPIAGDEEAEPLAPRLPPPPARALRSGTPLIPQAPIRAKSARPRRAGAPTLFTTTDLGAGKASHVAEPSVAKNGLYVLETYNWGAAVSTNGGGSFQFVDPKKALPNDYGGFCCDQLALYDPSRNLWIWVLQYKPDQAGNNAIRLAVARGDAALAAGQFHYWDLTPQQLAATGDGVSYDQPKIARSSNYLYLSIATYASSSKFAKSVVLRIALDALLSSGSLNYSDYVTSTFSPALTQGAAGTMYFATHAGATTLRLFSWPESVGASGVTSKDLVVHADSATRPFSCPRSGGSASSDWCRGSHDGKTASHDTRINAGWVDRGTIGFSWDAPQGTGGFGSFPFPYVHTVRIAESTRRVIDEPLLWSSTFAYQYAAIAPNSNGDLGGTVMYGGGAQFENCAVVVHDSSTSGAFFDVASAATSSADPVRAASGDYLTARPDPARAGGWIGTCYTVRGAGENKDVHPYFLAFGRAGGPPPPLPPPGDRQAPSVTAHPASVKHGTKRKLRFEFSDDSGKATVTSGVYRGTKRITDLGAEELKSGAYYDTWKAPRKRQLLSYCVAAEDASGNQSPRSCAAIRVT